MSQLILIIYCLMTGACYAEVLAVESVARRHHWLNRPIAAAAALTWPLWILLFWALKFSLWMRRK